MTGDPSLNMQYHLADARLQHENDVLRSQLLAAQERIRALEDRYLSLKEEHIYLKMSQPTVLKLDPAGTTWTKGYKSE